MRKKCIDPESRAMSDMQEQRVASEEEQNTYMQQKEKVREPGFIRVFSSYVGRVE